MKNPKLFVRRVTSVLVLMMLFDTVMWPSALTGWTTMGSTGAVDEDSISIVGLRGPFAELKTNCLFWGNI